MKAEEGEAGLGAVVALVRELPGISPLLTAGAALGIITNAVLRPAIALATGAVVGSVPAAIDQGWDSPVGQRLMWGAVIAVALFASSQLIQPAADAVVGVLGRRVERECRRRLILATSALPLLTDLEDPKTQDDVSSAQAVGTQQATVSLAVVNL